MNHRLLGTAAVLLSAFLAWQGIGMQAPFAYEPLGPNAFPLMVAVVMVICGIILICQGGGQAEANPPGANTRIALMVACIAAYAMAFEPLGFVLSTAAMTAIIGRLFGGAWRWTILSGLIMGIAAFILFDRVLDVVLPQGILEGIFDIFTGEDA